MKRILLIVCTAAVVLYGLDFLSVKLRIPRRDTFGTITMHTYYVVKLKNGKLNTTTLATTKRTARTPCSRSWASSPAGTSARHTEEQIVIDSGNPNNPHIF